jgi:CubicO group peptidase (beta-lactamase class C family)
MKLARDLTPALQYARTHALHALVLAQGNDVVAEEFGNGFTAETPHALYSGTKSFWGVTALYARADGLLELDEPVAETIASWRNDAWKRRVTIRMLLTLTAGFGFGGLGASVPTYDRAIETTLRYEPGTRFQYGGIPLQVFGAVVARKLGRETTPHEYLRDRVLKDSGVTLPRWRTLSDGTLPLPTGASLCVQDWLAYGRFILRRRHELAECFEGSSVNPRYGLAWWLGDGLFYASGSAGQALYVVPSLDLVAVHFAKSSSYRHEAFLKRLFE